MALLVIFAVVAAVAVIAVIFLIVILVLKTRAQQEKSKLHLFITFWNSSSHDYKYIMS